MVVVVGWGVMDSYGWWGDEVMGGGKWKVARRPWEAMVGGSFIDRGEDC